MNFTLLRHLITWVILLTIGCTAPAYRPEGSGPFYTVKNGDTLGSIAERFNSTAYRIADENSLQNPDALTIGQVLKISTEQVKAPAAKWHFGSRPGEGKKLDISHHRHQIGRLCTPLEKNEIISRFGSRNGSFHEGIDIKAKEGDPVYAVTNGEVILSGSKNGYGKTVVIKDGSLLTVYAHNSKNLVRKGEIVNAGQKIARAGQTGNAASPHLHFETRVRIGDGKYVAVNPKAFYPDGKGRCS